MFVILLLFSFASLQAEKKETIGYWIEKTDNLRTLHFSDSFPQMLWFEPPQLLIIELQCRTKTGTAWLSKGPNGMELVLENSAKIQKKAVSHLRKRL